MVRLNLSLDDVEKCEETTTFIKIGVINLAYIQGLSFEKPKQPDKFTASKTRRSVRKSPKLEVVINFKWF